MARTTRSGGQDGRGKRGERTVGVVLEAAARLWSARGFAGASVREIAQEAGVTAGVLGYHFQSKEGLYARLIDEGMASLRDELLVAFAEGDDLRTRLLGVVKAYQVYLASGSEVPRLVLRGVLDGDAWVIEKVAGHLRPLWEVLVGVVGEETPLGATEDVAMSFFGSLIAPTLYGPLFEALWGDVPGQDERRMRHIEALVDGVLAWRESVVGVEDSVDKKGVSA